MDLLATALIAGLLILIVITGISAIPTILFVLNPDSMRYSFDDPVAEQERISRSAELRVWITRLREMGFSMLGIKAERLPLWGRTYREAALVSRAAEAYASIVLDPADRPASLYFFTPLTNGGMVFTRNHPYGREVETEPVSVKNVPSKDFQEIMDSHEKRLRVFLDRGWRPLIGSGQQARIDATRAFYQSKYARQPGLFLISPGVQGFILSFLSLLILAIWSVMDLAGGR
ncbi:MAG: hypothetical protein JW748_09755 [Anaerolineales bacterium]|nr:hypothetical protein [Anaerolineales bacterium]